MREVHVYSGTGGLLMKYKVKEMRYLNEKARYIRFADENNKEIIIFTNGSLGVIIEEK